MIRTRGAAWALAGLMGATLYPAPGHAQARGPSPAAIAFARLKSLAGTWKFGDTGTAPGTLMPVGTVSYEVVSNGTAILERVSGPEHGPSGMVSIIRLDGDRLVLDHYCSDGNQPRLVASRDLAGMEIRFDFESATGLASPEAGHIHSAVFSFRPDGGFESRWGWRQAGATHTGLRRHVRAGAGPAGR